MIYPPCFFPRTAQLATCLAIFATLPLHTAPPVNDQSTAPATTEAPRTIAPELTGRVTEFNAKLFAVRSEGQAHPMRFAYRDNTHWENAHGKALTIDSLRLGATVRVSYQTRGKVAEATKVVIHQATTVPKIETNDTEAPVPAAPK